MTLMDLLVVTAVFGAFIFLILSRVNKNNPEFIPKIKEWLNKTKDPPKQEGDYSKQIWHEKRQIM